jgi:predicted DNA-binding transcriptional regulator AlpA
MVRCQNCGHYPVSHNGGRSGPAATEHCVAIDCDCLKFVHGKYRRTKAAAKVEVADMNWYEKAVQAANRIDAARTTPRKLASTYALLSIAESLARQLPVSRQSAPARQGPTVPAPNGEILTPTEVAEMTRQQPSTLRWWRAVGAGGPKSFKLGRRVMYRRADVEQWLAAQVNGAGIPRHSSARHLKPPHRRTTTTGNRGKATTAAR